MDEAGPSSSQPSYMQSSLPFLSSKTGSTPYRSPGPKMTYSDRFIPSRAVSSRLNYSLLDREAAASEVPRKTADREESSNAYNMLLRSELLGVPMPINSPERQAAGAFDPLRSPNR